MLLFQFEDRKEIKNNVNVRKKRSNAGALSAFERFLLLYNSIVFLNLCLKSIANSIVKFYA